MIIDQNLQVAPEGVVECRHCSAIVGTSVKEPFSKALRNERPASAAGAGIHASSAAFTDRTIVLRQRFCPGCLVLLATEIVPDDEQSYRTWSLQ